MAKRDIAIFFADEAIRTHLAEVAKSKLHGHSDGTCRVSFSLRSRAKAKIALIAYDGAVTFVAGIEGDSRADDIRWLFSLSSVASIGIPLVLSRLRSQLKSSQQRPLNEQGAFSPRASEIVYNILVDHQPSLGPTLDELLTGRRLDLPPEQEARFAQERDGIASLFSFAGFSGLMPENGLLNESEEASLPDRDSFLPETQGGLPREDPMIEHDANSFLGWSPMDSDTLALRSYTDGADRKLLVMNVNRWSIETRLGPDLIYYHVQRRSFVLVQYKRMVLKDDKWQCPIDSQFRKQLTTMKALDDECQAAGSGDGFRFLDTPSFVKICRLDNLDIDSRAMVSGMCMPREQVELHLAGPDALRTFSYDDVKDYMTSTLFAQLIASGYVGTSGASTELVKQEIDNALNGSGSVTVGAVSDTSGKRPTWGWPGRSRRRLPN